MNLRAWQGARKCCRFIMAGIIYHNNFIHPFKFQNFAVRLQQCLLCVVGLHHDHDLLILIHEYSQGLA
jgi:hypothetical protein